MNSKQPLNYLKTNLWLLFGAISFLSIAISSIFKVMLEEESFNFSYLLFNIVDWFAASVVYFFIGALLGYLIDALVRKIRKQKASCAVWPYIFAAFWVVASVMAGYLAPEGTSFVVILLFPMIYGIFFPGFAFITLFQSMQYSDLARSIFDVGFLSIFGAWVYLEVTNKKKILKRILLAIFMLILLVGAKACASSL